MKKLIFLSLFFTTSTYAQNICVDVNADDKQIVETYVIDADEWLQEAWNMKVANRRDALIKEEVQYSLDNQVAIPGEPDQIVKQGMKRLGTRKERDQIPLK